MSKELDYIAELEKENAELKHTIAELRREKDILNTHTKAQEKLAKYCGDQLTKAKELINLFVQWNYGCCKEPDYKDLVKQAEQFIKEIEKMKDEEIKEEFRCSPSIHVKNIYDLKKLLTPFFPQGLAIIIHFILFVSMWVFIFNCCNK